MPPQALLAAFLAFVSAAFCVLTPWDPSVAFEANPPVTVVQWGMFWLLLVALAVGLGRHLDAPLPRLLAFAPTALLLVIGLADRPSPGLELGRMYVPVPAIVRAMAGTALSGAVWYVALIFAPRMYRWLADQQGR